jgi:peroxiredoxin-like protein
METKKTYKSFRYQTGVAWKERRKGTVSLPGKPELEISSPPEFKGDAGIWTPEDLFVSSLNTCIMETYLAFAERQGLELVAYECAAEGRLSFVEGKYRFTEITLQPQVTVKSQDEIEKARELVETAHANCFVSNSITAAVKITPQIRAA